MLGVADSLNVSVTGAGDSLRGLCASETEHDASSFAEDELACQQSAELEFAANHFFMIQL